MIITNTDEEIILRLCSVFYEVTDLTGEEKLLIAKFEDMFKLCDKYRSPRFSSFLNEAQQILIENNFRYSGYNVKMYGGFFDAQRKIFGIFPEWIEIDLKEYPIKVIRITKKYNKELTHRDYLGTILSLGIDRKMVGDIVCDDEGAFIYVLEEIAEFICSSIFKIANIGVEVTIKDCFDIEPPKQKFEVIDAVCASERLDAILGAIINTSRRISQELIKASKVSVNHIEVTNTDFILKPNDIISVRGFGRFIYVKKGLTTRSQRIHIEAKKFI